MKTKLCNIKIEYAAEPVGVSTKFPHYSWEFVCDAQNVFQKGYRIKVIGFINELFWDSGFVESDKSFGIKHGGKPLEPDTEYRVIFEVKLGEEVLLAESHFRTGMLDQTFSDALWITAPHTTCPLMRKTFFSGKKVAYATAYISAKGFYELYINEKRVGDRILAPANLSPRSFPYYYNADAYDVTQFLTLDNNTVGIWLARGYSKSDFSPYGWTYEGEEMAWLALSIQYEDGDYALITTDQSWICHQSPIISNSIYHGEAYNKNLEISGWCNPYTDTSEWLPCVPAQEQEGILNLYTVPVKQLSRENCVNLEAREDEVIFCDFGINGAGYLCIKVIGEPGARVIITHSENINPDGSLNTFTNRDANATDVYILKGHELEIYEPRFTYHCFRYAEIRMDGVAQLISAQKVTIGADLSNQSSFYCNDRMLQRFYDNAMRSVRSNLMNHPTDCAVRDERTPCLMDTMAYEELCIHSLDMQSYYRHWLENIKNEVDPNGHFPLWDGDVITLPKLMEEHYGDTEIAEEMYPKMKWAVEKGLETYKKDGFESTFGDWCAPINNPENDYLKCNHFGGEAGLCAAIFQLNYLMDLASRLNKNSDIDFYRQTLEFYQNELYNRFFNEKDGCFSGGQQTPNLMALGLGAVKSEHIDGVYTALKKHIIETDKYRHTTGISGTRLLIRVLSRDKEGLEILSRMLHSTEYPSFGRQVLEYDATTLLEQWLNLEGMMSCDHPMFGGIFADYYRIFAGITGSEQYGKILIAPKLPPDLSELRCRYHSVRGPIEVYLRRVGEKYHIDVVIPPNCTAHVITPDGKEYNLGNGKYILT